VNARIKLPVVDSYERPDMCTPCAGNCCRQMPGSAMPHDFGDSPEEILAGLTAKLKTGRWAIDWWEGDPRDEGDQDFSRSYYVRPAVRDGGRGLFDPSYGGPCTFHGAGGCEIFDERPSGCRGLDPVPGPPIGCTVQHSSKQDCAIAWLPFHDLILEAAGER